MSQAGLVDVIQKGKLDLRRLKADAKELLTDVGLCELDALISEFGEAGATGGSSA